MTKRAVVKCDVSTDWITTLRNRYAGVAIEFYLCDAHAGVLSLLTHAKTVS